MSSRIERAFAFSRRHPFHLSVVALVALSGVGILVIYVLSWFTVESHRSIRNKGSSTGIRMVHDDLRAYLRVFGWLIVLYILFWGLGSVAFLPLLMLTRVPWAFPVINGVGSTIIIFYFAYVVEKSFPDSLFAAFKGMGAMPGLALVMALLLAGADYWGKVVLKPNGFGYIGSVATWLLTAFFILVVVYGRIDLEHEESMALEEEAETGGA